MTTLPALRRQMDEFNRSAPRHENRARRLMRETTYWVYDPSLGAFGPSKHLGLDAISLADYLEHGYWQANGGVTRKAISRVLAAGYTQCPALHEPLMRWGDALVGPGALDGLSSDKWAFVEIPDESRQVEPEEFERRVRTYTRSSLDELTRRFARRYGRAHRRAVEVTVQMRVRDPLVVAIARRRAMDRCEIPGCPYRPFATVDGSPYVEVHHITTLADSGPDHPSNVACLCPNHHRELHYGRHATQLREQLRAIRARDT